MRLPSYTPTSISLVQPVLFIVVAFSDLKMGHSEIDGNEG